MLLNVKYGHNMNMAHNQDTEVHVNTRSDLYPSIVAP